MSAKATTSAPKSKYSSDTWVFVKPHAGTVGLRATRIVQIPDTANPQISRPIESPGVSVVFQAAKNGRGHFILSKDLAKRGGYDYDEVLKLMLDYEEVQSGLIKIAVKEGELQKGFTEPLEPAAARGPALTVGVKASSDMGPGR